MLAFFWKSLLNNERWKVLEALRNTFVKSPQTHENRDERRPIITGSRCVTLFLELLTILLFKFFSTKVAMVVSSDRQSKRGDKIPHKKFQDNCGNGCLGKRSSALTGKRRLIIRGE